MDSDRTAESSNPVSTKEDVKNLRKQIDACIQEVAKYQPSRALALVKTKLEEAKMWGGKRLEELNPTDYPAELADKAE